ncbi:hypothetical protein BWQ96_10188 [Gracilariopsis chorda]|uniref:F-box domain-containing protein n=1 Tax=Gracilariopsis chorda TaxID=448386 RepID=A0A2V3IFY4_9FLOR|nr:hypothetical protein BWQ96_10188 [Gracilariopsis chorda]|eukprot:PXF40090.1 hypothetical protein BWQ96_10188 [Gracilariopsis chorda]
MDAMEVDTDNVVTMNDIPDRLVRHIFSFLEPQQLEAARQVCQRWNECASHHLLWRKHCFTHSPSLRTERSAWPLLACCKPVAPIQWRYVYRTLQNRPRCTVTLQKAERFLCNMIAHLIKGPYAQLPSTLVVQRRFDIMYLPFFLNHNCTYFYLEPLTEADKGAYDDFVNYLIQRDRAGLVMTKMNRFMLIPPCRDVGQRVNYTGDRLIAAVQPPRL